MHETRSESSVYHDIGYNWNSPAIRRTESREYVLLFDQDPKYCKQVMRIGRKRGLRVLVCFNFSDFWALLSTHREELVAIVANFKFVNKMVKGSKFHRIGRLPIVVTSSTPHPETTIRSLPFYNPAFVQKKLGASVLLDKLIDMNESRNSTSFSIN